MPTKTHTDESGGNCVLDAGGTLTTVWDTPAAGWVERDLSPWIGKRRAWICLKVYRPTGADDCSGMRIRRCGETNTTEYYMNRITNFVTANKPVHMACMTDDDGVIEEWAGAAKAGYYRAIVACVYQD